MRQSRPLAGGHDGFEAHAFGSVKAGLVFEFGCDFDLANTGPDDGKDVLKKPASDKSVF